MKNFKYLLLLSLCTLTLMGCEKKEDVLQRENSVLKGEEYLLEIWTAQDGDFFEALGKEFINSSNEPGLSIEVVAFPNEEVLHESFLQHLAEGRSPDIIFTDSSWIAQNKSKMSPFLSTQSLTADVFKQQSLPAGHILVSDEVIWGIPIGIETLGIIYNEDLFIKNLENQVKPGKSWESFYQDVLQLKRPDNSFARFSLAGAGLGIPENTHHGFWIFENIMKQIGGEFFSSENTQAVFSSLNNVDPNGRRYNIASDTLTFLSSFADSRKENFTWTESFVEKDTPEKEYKPFIEGKIGVVFGTTRDYKKILSLLETADERILTKDMIRTAELPQAEQDKRATAKTWGLGVSRGSANPEISWRFLLFAMSPDNLRSYFQATGVPSSSRSLFLEQSSDVDTGSLIKPILYAETPLYPLERKNLKNLIEDAWMDVFKRKDTPEKALEKVEEKINKTLEENIVLQRKIDIVEQKKQP